MSRLKKCLFIGVAFLAFATAFFYGSMFLFRQYSTDPEGELLKVLSRNRVVMLADFEHSAALPYKSVIWLFDRWLSAADANKVVPTRLTLVLEIDEKSEIYIRRYLHSGVLPGPRDLAWHPLERLEFYDDLRRIEQKIILFNSRVPESRQLAFDILGVEPPQDIRGAYTRMDSKENFEFFTKERDRLSANRVIDYAKSNPENKLVFFYGGAHLQRGLRNKDQWGLFPGETRKDYYLIQYVDEFFGRKNVFTVNQRDFPKNSTPGYTKVCKYLTGNISTASVILYSTFQENLAAQITYGGSFFDAIIVRRASLTAPIPLAAIPLREMVRVCLDRLAQLDSADGFQAKREKSYLLDCLQLATGQKFASGAEGKDWLHRGGSNFWIEADGPLKKLSGFLLESTKKRKELYKKLFLFRDEDFEEPRYETTIKKLILVSLIGTMWVGKDSERALARKLLIGETGYIGDTPGQYLVWLRKNHYDLSY